jgi:hypothetical protein
MSGRRPVPEILGKTHPAGTEDLLRLTIAGATTGDAFLLKGSRNLTWSQRTTAWVLGLFFFALGLAIALVGARVPPVLLGGFGFMLLGAWVFRNGFPRKGRPDPEV